MYPLNVLVDASNFKPVQGGVRTYTRGLLRGLADDERLRVHVATSIEEDLTDIPGLATIALPPATQSVAARVAWRETALPRLTRRLRADIVLAPVPELPMLRGLPVPSVIVVHDVGPLVAPALYGMGRYVRYWAGLPRAVRLASAIVCVSHTTLSAVHAVLGVDPCKCLVIGEAPQFDEPGTTPSSQANGRAFVLYVGALYRHKNVASLIEGFADAARDSSLELLLAGPRDTSEWNRLLDLCRRLGIENRVVHEGFVSSGRLRELYSEARLVALPSLYEGFGLTVLEAMRSGAPVVASDIPAVREVAGEAAVLIDRPLDASCWSEGIRRVASDDSLRDRLRSLGLRRSREFSWQAVGQRFADLFVRLAETKR